MDEFDIDKIADRINPRIYERGMGYYGEGRVRNLRVEANALLAVVTGTEKYKVRIENEEGVLKPRCDCPFKDEEFCKHSVATLLAWKHRNEDKESPSEHVSEQERTELLRKAISRRSRKELADLILEHVPDEKTELILAQCGLKNEKAKNLFARSMKAKINSLFRGGRFIDYQSSFDVAGSMAEILRAIDESSRDDRMLGLEMLWHLLRKSKNVFNDIDDSSGVLGDEICSASKLVEDCLNKTEESKRKDEIIFEIFREWLGNDYGYFDCLFDVLTSAKFTEKEIAKLLPEIDREILSALQKISGEADKTGKFMHTFNLSQMLLLYARFKIKLGNAEEGLNRLKQHLHLTKDYDTLGTLLLELRRFPEAERYFKEGLRLYPGRKEELYNGLIFLYGQTDSAEKLTEVLLESFHYDPTPDAYEKLKTLRLPGWDAVRKELFSFLNTPQRHHVLISIHMSEKNALEAFNTAREYKDGAQTLVHIGEELKEDHPEEAVWCYKQAFEETVSRGSRYYWIALRHVDEIRGLCERTGKRDEFGKYISDVRNKHKMKRTLIKKLSRC